MKLSPEAAIAVCEQAAQRGGVSLASKAGFGTTRNSRRASIAYGMVQIHR